MQLTSKTVTFIALRYGQGLPFSQISKLLKISEGQLRALEAKILRESKENDKMDKAWDALLEEAGKTIRAKVEAKKKKKPELRLISNTKTMADKLRDFEKSFDD